MKKTASKQLTTKNVIPSKSEMDLTAERILSRPCERKTVPLDLIDINPKNRKRFKPGTIEELATDIFKNGLIHEIILRPRPAENSEGAPTESDSKPATRYQLVTGERRYKASKLAGLPDIESKIYILTDAEERSIRISENGHREDLHDLEHAQAIAEMQNDYPTLDEIARQLSKSKSYVQSFLKLNDLIDPIQEMFLADKIKTKEALLIAMLDADCQTKLFEEYFKNWKKDKHFTIYNLQDKLEKYKYNLKSAPFSIKSKILVPEAGSCDLCQHNSSVINSFFPDEEKTAFCNKRSCFDQKCAAQFKMVFLKAINDYSPEYLIFNGEPSPILKKWVEEIPGATNMPRANAYSVMILNEPTAPAQNDYCQRVGNKRKPDSSAFKTATISYKKQYKQYQDAIKGSKIKSGLYLMERGLKFVYFSPETLSQNVSSKSKTAKEVETLIKLGRAGANDVKEQIEKTKVREKRILELAAEAVQETIHSQFDKFIRADPGKNTLTAPDQTAERWLIFDSLTIENRNLVSKYLFPKKTGAIEATTMYQKFSKLSKSENSYLVRIALLQKYGSKNPKCPEAYFLRKIAETAGCDIKRIEAKQAEITSKKLRNPVAKIATMQKYLKKKTA